MNRRTRHSEPLRKAVGELLCATEVEWVERLQALWGGYGELWRISFLAQGDPEWRSAVLKWVEPPAGDDGLSHRRKLRSYAVEWHWYKRYAQLCDERCRVPRCLAQRSTPGSGLLVLEDLTVAGFPERRSRLRADELDASLAWLAHFHARFLGQAPDGLWKAGTYWHLATRPDELAVLSHAELKRAAPLLDARLRGARFRTLVHGDAKVENFCFGPAGVAAVDFQYVGGGVGVQDVAYFLGSCLEPRAWSRSIPALLDAYFRHLRDALSSARTDGDASDLDVSALEREWRDLYPVAWADFYRFLLGWAPGEPRDSYSEAQLALAWRGS